MTKDQKQERQVQLDKLMEDIQEGAAEYGPDTSVAYMCALNLGALSQEVQLLEETAKITQQDGSSMQPARITTRHTAQPTWLSLSMKRTELQLQWAGVSYQSHQQCSKQELACRQATSSQQ